MLNTPRHYGLCFLHGLIKHPSALLGALLGGAMCIIAFVTPAPSTRDILSRLGETVATG